MQCLAPHNLQYASASIWCPFLVACDFTQCSSWFRRTCYSQLSQGICMINKYKLLVEIVSLCCNLQGFSLHLSWRNTTLVQASWCEKFYIAMSLGKGTAAGSNLNVLRKPYDLEQHFAGCANHLTWQTNNPVISFCALPSLCLFCKYDLSDRRYQVWGWGVVQHCQALFHWRLEFPYLWVPIVPWCLSAIETC